MFLGIMNDNDIGELDASDVCEVHEKNLSMINHDYFTRSADHMPKGIRQTAKSAKCEIDIESLEFLDKGQGHLTEDEKKQERSKQGLLDQFVQDARKRRQLKLEVMFRYTNWDRAIQPVDWHFQFVEWRSLQHWPAI